MTEPSPSILAEAERLLNREALEEALQAAWNDFCSDTGCFPDCFSMTKKELWADFRKGPFANEVALHLSPAVAAALQARDERIKVLEAALKPFSAEAELWNDIRESSAPTYVLKAALRLNVQMLRDARTALKPVPTDNT